MALEFLLPVSDKVLAHNTLLPGQAIGNKMSIHTEKNGLPSLKGVQLAFIGVHESRNAFEKKSHRLAIDAIRIQWYKLMFGNWNCAVVDLGDVPEGAEVSDTYFVLNQVVSELVGQGIVPIIVGATQDITYPIYRSFDASGKMVNIVSIDSRFDFGTQDELISSHSYMSKIITEKPTNLFNFSNLGYQSYFNAQEALDLMDKLYFDAYRLGSLTNDLSIAEPVLRGAHIVGIDTRAIRASEMGGGSEFSPNGFDGREICTLARYAGLSDAVAVFGIFESDNHSQSTQMVAQIIWYFMEGYGFRHPESPLESPDDFIKYTLPFEDRDLVFYKSQFSQRWWVGVSFLEHIDNKAHATALLPCTEQDYLGACNHIIPERWFKAQKKGFI
jgi:hypothetical protein